MCDTTYNRRAVKSRSEKVFLGNAFDFKRPLVGKGVWWESNLRGNWLEFVEALVDEEGGEDCLGGLGNLPVRSSILPIMTLRAGQTRPASKWFNAANVHELIWRSWVLISSLRINSNCLKVQKSTFTREDRFKPRAWELGVDKRPDSQFLYLLTSAWASTKKNSYSQTRVLAGSSWKVPISDWSRTSGSTDIDVSRKERGYRDGPFPYRT